MGNLFSAKISSRGRGMRFSRYGAAQEAAPEGNRILAPLQRAKMGRRGRVPPKPWRRRKPPLPKLEEVEVPELRGPDLAICFQRSCGLCYLPDLVNSTA